MKTIVAAVIVDDLETPTRFLAAQRSYPADLAGQWEFPGGKVEPGEDPVEALRREIREELGVELTLGNMVVGPRADGWPIPPGVMLVWLATTTDTVRPTEHSALTWCDKTGPDLPWLAGDRDLVAHLTTLLHQP